MLDWSDFGAALALVFVIEGLLPLLSPRGFRDAMQVALRLDDRALRVLGLVSMMTGAGLLYWIR